MSRAWADWPEEPLARRLREGDRVRVGDDLGTVTLTWRSPRGYDRPGEDFVRVELDGQAVTRRAAEVELIEEEER
jgi:hypothetical protein